MPKCEYIFTNNSKTHQKGQTCGSVIKKKDNKYCSKHQTNNILVSENVIEQDSPQMTFIQLESSVENKI
jgi:hypothetical protein